MYTWVWFLMNQIQTSKGCGLMNGRTKKLVEMDVDVTCIVGKLKVFYKIRGVSQGAHHFFR